jgi:ATP synthase protein I
MRGPYRGIVSADAPHETSAIRAMAWILAAQLLIALLVALAGGVFAGEIEARSGLVGGMICLLPNTFLALRIVIAGLRQDAQALVRGMYVAEAGKMAISVLLFIAAFTLVRPMSAGWLFTGYIATTLVMWGALGLDRTGFVRQNPEEADTGGSG